MTRKRCLDLSVIRVALLVASVLMVAAGPPAVVYGQANISINLPFAEVIREARAWWEAVVARGDAEAEQATQESARRLILGFTRMAALMDLFADQIEKASFIPQHTHDLRQLVRDMEATLVDIREAVNAIDVDWGIDNLELVDQAFTLEGARGMAVGRARRLVVRFNDGSTSVLDTQETQRLAVELRRLAEAGRELASDIKDALKAEIPDEADPYAAQELDR